MSMFQQDQESVLKGIQKFIKDIFNGNDEEAKKKLCRNLHEITKICHCSNDFQKANFSWWMSRFLFGRRGKKVFNRNAADDFTATFFSVACFLI